MEICCPSLKMTDYRTVDYRTFFFGLSDYLTIEYRNIVYENYRTISNRTKESSYWIKESNYRTIGYWNQEKNIDAQFCLTV
jgi:hypothetical protein